MRREPPALTPLALEEVSLNAWPALQTVVYDGWLLRFAEGYTRRANSVNPLYPSTLDLDEKLDFCEETYRGRGLPVIFKLTEGAQPSGLDATLAARGYRVDAPTAVELLDLDRAAVQPAPDVIIEKSLIAEWLDAFARMRGLSGRNRAILPRVLADIVPIHSYASLSVEGHIAAAGLGVVQSGCIGLYDIVTDPAFRSRGYGRRIVESLLVWSRAGSDNGLSPGHAGQLPRPAPLRSPRVQGILPLLAPRRGATTIGAYRGMRRRRKTGPIPHRRSDRHRAFLRPHSPTRG